jgi:hypothetical protein
MIHRDGKRLNHSRSQRSQVERRSVALTTRYNRMRVMGLGTMLSRTNVSGIETPAVNSTRQIDS